MNVYLSTYDKIFRRLSEMLFRNLMLINFCLLRSVGHRIWVKRGLSGTLWILIPVLIKAEAVWSQQLKSWSNLFSCEHWGWPGCHHWRLHLPKACAEQGETAEETIILQMLVEVLPLLSLRFWRRCGAPTCHPARLRCCVFVGVLLLRKYWLKLWWIYCPLKAMRLQVQKQAPELRCCLLKIVDFLETQALLVDVYWPRSPWTPATCVTDGRLSKLLKDAVTSDLVT